MPKTRIIGAVCLCFILVTAFACGGSDSASNQNVYEGAIATARSEIWQAINSGKCGSATAAIMVDGKVVYAEGFGMANREQSIPVTADTLFNMGSISKIYVSTAVMLLVDDGLVSLDKPVTTYLQEFRMADERYKKITVRMLLNHSSGMPGSEYSNSLGLKYNPNIQKETLNTLARSHLKSEPGARAAYCNDGFTLAEMIVERMSKGKYMDFLGERIFKPLGLDNTGVSVGEIKGKPVASYYDPATGKRRPLEANSVLGAGGLSATAGDICRFMDAFSAEDKLLKKASLAEMRKIQPSAFWDKLRNPQFSYGLGWDLTGLTRYDAAGIQVLGKSGGTANYSSMVYTVPDKRISVAFIASGSESGAMKIALNILDAVLVAKKLLPKAETPLAVPPAPQKLPEDHASFGGYYADDTKLSQVVFDAEKNTATLYNFKGQVKTPAMTLIYNNGYYYDPSGTRYYFAQTEGETYFVNNIPLLGIDLVMQQKVKPIANPQGLRIAMDARLWLRRNVAPYETAMFETMHMLRSSLYQDLQGYVFLSGLKRIDSPEFAGMPFDAIRDQSELTLFEKDGATWAWANDLLFGPAEAAVALKVGENSVTIGVDGYNEWLTANEDMVLSFTKPEGGRIVIFSPDNAPVYDSAVDTGDVYVTRGSYIESAGLANDVFTVKAKSIAADEKK